jgi:hypothetical protein
MNSDLEDDTRLSGNNERVQSVDKFDYEFQVLRKSHGIALIVHGSVLAMFISFSMALVNEYAISVFSMSVSGSRPNAWEVVVKPAGHAVLSWISVVYLIVEVTWHAVSYTQLLSYEQQVVHRHYVSRWIAHAATSCLVVVHLALQCGIVDVRSLMLVTALQFGMVFCFYMSDPTTACDQPRFDAYFCTSAFAILKTTILCSNLYAQGKNTPPSAAVGWFIHTVAEVVFSFMHLFTLTRTASTHKFPFHKLSHMLDWSNPCTSETWFVVLIGLSVQCVAWASLGGSLKQ